MSPNHIQVSERKIPCIPCLTIEHFFNLGIEGSYIVFIKNITYSFLNKQSSRLLISTHQDYDACVFMFTTINMHIIIWYQSIHNVGLDLPRNRLQIDTFTTYKVHTVG